jgi:hypothetical protein
LIAERLVGAHLVLPGDMLALEGLLIIADLGVGLGEMSTEEDADRP